MTFDRDTVRIAGTMLTTLVAALFVQAYGVQQANFISYSRQVTWDVLPLPTAFYHHYALVGYALPAALALLFFFRKPHSPQREITIEIFLKLAGVLALAWLLGALLAWQLPFYASAAPLK